MKVKGIVCVDQGKVTLSKRGVAHGIGGEAGPKVVRNPLAQLKEGDALKTSVTHSTTGMKVMFVLKSLVLL